VSTTPWSCMEGWRWSLAYFIIIIIYLNCRWVFTRWQCTTIRHNTQITHHTQTDTAHKTTQTIKDTLHTILNIWIRLRWAVRFAHRPLNLRRKSRHCYFLAGSVNHRAVVEAVVVREVFLCLESNPDSSIIQPVASRYFGRTIPDPHRIFFGTSALGGWGICGI
jgi:hypothetical protein